MKKVDKKMGMIKKMSRLEEIKNDRTMKEVPKGSTTMKPMTEGNSMTTKIDRKVVDGKVIRTKC